MIVRLWALRKNTLYTNALFLMLSTFTLAATGFLFWIFVTRSYDTAAVGLATTLLSVSGLLSLLGLAGLDTTLVRFLPTSERRNDYINSGYVIVTLLSIALAGVFGALLPLVSPSLSILDSPWAYIGFVMFTATSALVTLTSAVFLAFKQARYIFMVNALLGVLKVLLALVVAPGDAMTIFVIAGAAQVAGLALGITWMKRTFDYRFLPRLHMDMLRVIKKFSVTMYAASILNLLPPTLLPLIIVYLTGPENAAYYYMAFTIASILYTIAYASMQSMFAEGSHNEAAMGAHIKKAARLIAILLLPATILMACLGNILLSIFGQEYAAQAGSLLQLFALSSLPVAVYSALGAVFKVTKNLAGIVGMNAAYTAVILGMSFWLMPVAGIVAVGWAWLAGNITACIIGTLFLIATKKQKEKTHGTITSTRR
jgi:O-antigen/teichoic acid export membrane protein